MSSFPAFTYATWSSSSEPWTTLGELTSAGGCTAAPPAMPGASCFVFWRAASVRVTTRRCLKSLPWIPTTLTADHRLVGYHRTPRLYHAKQPPPPPRVCVFTVQRHWRRSRFVSMTLTGRRLLAIPYFLELMCFLFYSTKNIYAYTTKLL